MLVVGFCIAHRSSRECLSIRLVFEKGCLLIFFKGELFLDCLVNKLVLLFVKSTSQGSDISLLSQLFLRSL